MKGKLIRMAIEAREKAYCPYSDFKVGAAALFEDGNIYTGCNIENASYGATNCAERTAIFSGVASGARSLEAIAIIGDTKNFTYPCGICRQVMVEFAKDDNMKIYIVKSENDYIETTIGEIVPGMFSKKDLKN
ncbi:MAG: cytidine deaminase [Sarcina sp.]